ncbi:MAG: DUF885 domain-containing protein [Hyphomonadaceae bacterium]|nr:DUF885 domain-containing protein [Hyphomonadaceae bacterium]
MLPNRWVATLFLTLIVAACGPGQAPPLTAYEGKLADWAREILQDSPELAAQTGVPEDLAGGPYGDRLDDRTALAVDARRSAALRRLVELRGLDPEHLDEADRLNYAVVRAQFENAANAARFQYGDFTQLGGVKPYVLNQLDSAFITLPSFLDERHAVTTTADAEAYLRRLEQVAVALDAETNRARTDATAGVRPPLFIIDATLSLLDAIVREPTMAQPYVTSFRRKLENLAAGAADAGARATIERQNLSFLARAEIIVRDRIIPAHQRAAAFLRSERANATDDPSVSRLPQGAEFYAAVLRLETTTPLTAAQIHDIGLARVATLSNELDIALRRVGLTEGPVGVRLARMTADVRYRYADSEEGRAQLLADVRARVALVMQRAPQWFARLPRAPLDVRPVPAFAEATQPGAYYSPPSIDGATPGVYYINLRDVGEMTRIDLPTQDFHEAAPGHHFQVALAQELPDAPLLRRLMAFNAYAEGWGLYAEQIADEVGFFDNDPVGRIGYLRWQMWRAARLVVDTGLHAKGWSRQQAIDYMLQVTGDAPGVVISEVDRYVVWPGQACGYELGRREIERVREVARNELGPDFDLRGFHSVMLLNGEVPINMLEPLVREWIPEQRRLTEREQRRR